eukprot:m51a1_g3502 hypothetical protein (634) ;mRNA; f:841480-843778
MLRRASSKKHMLTLLPATDDSESRDAELSEDTDESPAVILPVLAGTPALCGDPATTPSPPCPDGKIVYAYHKDVSPVDLSAGLLLLAVQREETRSVPADKDGADQAFVNPFSVPLRTLGPQDAGFVREAAAMMHHASAAYGWKVVCGFMTHVVEEDTAPPASTLAPILHNAEVENMASLVKHTRVRAADVVETRWCSKPFSPGHYVAIDRELNAAVVAFRGTWGVKDSVTDLMAFPEPFTFRGINGYAHKGVLTCAQRKLDDLVASGALDNAIAGCVGRKKVIVTGHSLGGGVATVFSLLLAEKRPDVIVQCYAFAPASALTLELAKSHDVRKIVRSFLYRDDLVPRMSLGSLGLLKRTVQNLQAQSDMSADPTIDEPQEHGVFSIRARARHVTHFVAASKIFGEKMSKYLARKAGGDGVSVSQALSDARSDALTSLLGVGNPEFLFPSGHLYMLHADYSSAKASTSASASPLNASPSSTPPLAEADAGQTVSTKKSVQPPRPKSPKTKPEKYIAEEIDQLALMEILISSDMFLDHLPHKLELSLDAAAKELETAPEEPFDPRKEEMPVAPGYSAPRPVVDLVVIPPKPAGTPPKPAESLLQQTASNTTGMEEDFFKDVPPDLLFAPHTLEAL